VPSSSSAITKERKKRREKVKEKEKVKGTVRKE